MNVKETLHIGLTLKLGSLKITAAGHSEQHYPTQLSYA